VPEFRNMAASWASAGFFSEASQIKSRGTKVTQRGQGWSTGEGLGPPPKQMTGSENDA